MSLPLTTDIVPSRAVRRAAGTLSSDQVFQECGRVVQASKVAVAKYFAASYAQVDPNFFAAKDGLVGSRAGRSDRIFSDERLTPNVRAVLQHMGMARERVGTLVNHLLSSVQAAALSYAVA